MGTIATAFQNAWRNFVTDNVPSSGTNKPVKSEIRAIGTTIETELGLLEDRIENVESGINWTSNSIRVRSTANVNISNGLENGDTLNGVTLATGNFVFLGSQSAPSQNGIYTVVSSGAASRASFADTAAELARIGFVIQSGTVGAGERWTLPMDAADITVGSTSLNFALVGIEPDFSAELVAARDGEASLSDRFERTDDEWYEADRFLEAIAGNAPTPRAFGSSLNLADFTTPSGGTVNRMEAIYGWMLGDAAFANQAYPVHFNAVAALAASATQYYGPGQASTTQGRAIFVCNLAGVLRKLYAAVDVAPGSGKNIVLTLVKNGVDQALTCTINGTGKTASDLVHDVTVAAGDLLELKAVSDSGATTNNALSATLSLGV